MPTSKSTPSAWPILVGATAAVGVCKLANRSRLTAQQNASDKPPAVADEAPAAANNVQQLVSLFNIGNNGQDSGSPP